MATNFTMLYSNKQEPKKTVFKKLVTSNSGLKSPSCQPVDFKNVLHIGFDVDYGDVFKAWNNNAENFFIFFGTAGDEFKK